MEKSINQNLKLGLFVILGAILFITGIYYIGQRQSMFGNTAPVFAIFNNTNGLKPGNNVRFSGINVGTVKEISMINDTMIILELSIDKDIMRHIKKDARAVIASDGLVGNMLVNIMPGNKSTIPVDAGDTIRSFSRVRTDEMLNTLSVTNENAALLTSELLKITRDISGGKGLVGAMIKDSTLIRDLHLILDNVRKTTEESVVAVKNLNKLVASLDQKDNLLGTIRDTAVAEQVKRIVSNIEKSSSDLENVILHLDNTIQHADGAVLNLKDGKGAVNYLSNDPILVHKIDRTISHVDSVVLKLNTAGIKLNENLEALKHNWFLRGYFKQQEKDKAKKK